MLNQYSNFWAKYGDLKQRILFTIGALIVYRIGTYVPVPGVNPEILNEFSKNNLGGILGMFDMFSGGALGRMTIFALNIVPYISSSIIIQLSTVIFPHLEALKKEGESGRRQLNKYTRYLTVIISAFQAYGISLTLLGFEVEGVKAVYIGSYYLLIAIPTLLGGTLFLMWLGEQITSRGISNGISLIIFSGIVSNLPASFIKTFELGRTGSLSIGVLLLVIIGIMALVVFVVFIERAQRKVLIQYPKASQAQPNNQPRSIQVHHLPLKINSSGVIPPIFAGSILLLPLTIAGFSGSNTGDSSLIAGISTYLSHGHPVYIALFSCLIIFFSFFYTSIVFNPTETAENLRKNGGIVPGIRPGSQTADHLDYILTRLTFLGALYLCFLCISPELLISKLSIPFYFSGTSILIVVNVAVETATQIRSYVLTHQYGSLAKKFRGKSGL